MLIINRLSGGGYGPNYQGRNDPRLQSLDLLRFPLALAVVFGHVYVFRDFTIKGVLKTIEDFPVFAEVEMFVRAFLEGYSVPVFFFISGFLFFLGVDLSKNVYINKLKRRISTLIVPYIIWNFIAMGIVLIKVLPCFSSLSPYEDVKVNLSPLNIFSCFWVYDGGLTTIEYATDAMPQEIVRHASPINGPLWYIRNLIIAVVFSPLLYWLIKRTKYYSVILLGVLWFFFAYFHIDEFIYRLFITFFFFSWGSYIAIHDRDLVDCFGRFFRSSMILYPFLGAFCMLSMHFFPEASGTLKRLNILIAPVFAYNLAYWLLTHNICKVNSFLVSASMFVYISHSILLGPIKTILQKVISPNCDSSLLIVYTLALILDVSVLLLALYLMRRFTPGLLKVVAGRK